MSEESRAVEYRRKMTARSQWECAQATTAFAGDADAAAAVLAAWDPILDREFGWDPPDQCTDDGRGLQVV